MNNIISTEETITRVSLFVFAIPWLVIGVQHYMYADFVATLVPSFISGKIVWVYITGTGMFAAGISFLLKIKVPLAAMLLGIMLMTFTLLIHVPKLLGHPMAINWTRAIQDTALMGTAFMLTNNIRLRNTGRLLYAVSLAVLGFQHFAHVSFITAKIPAYLPLINLWDYCIGILMISAAVYIVIKPTLLLPGILLGSCIGLFALLYNMPLLVSDVHNGQQWTGLMLDIALSAGAFITLRKVHAMHYVTTAVQ